MGKQESVWRQGATRRGALRGLAGFLAASPLLRSQQDPFRDHSRVPGMDELVTAFDFEAVAYEKLPRRAFNYTSYGTGGEFTLRRNREAFDWVELVPKGVVDVSTVQTATEVLGTKMAFPIMLAPTAGHNALHPDGELATHEGAAAAAGTPMIVSINTSFPIEKVAGAASGPLWYQLYPRQEVEQNRPLLESAQAAGCSGIVVTVDQQAGYYERSFHDDNLRGAESQEDRRRSRRRATPEPSPYRASTSRAWYEWKLFDDIRPFVTVPLLAKGVLTAHDARLFVEHGLDGIVVSNHGGRALDSSPSTLEVLPEIVDAVAGRIPVLVDGGFRRGSDVLKALALGASAVCLGRVARWGLGAFGAPGVQRVLEIVQAEFVLAMAHTGRPTLDSIDRTLVRTDFP